MQPRLDDPFELVVAYVEDSDCAIWFDHQKIERLLTVDDGAPER